MKHISQADPNSPEGRRMKHLYTLQPWQLAARRWRFLIAFPPLLLKRSVGLFKRAV
jgi:hypothetical protein